SRQAAVEAAAVEVGNRVGCEIGRAGGQAAGELLLIGEPAVAVERAKRTAENKPGKPARDLLDSSEDLSTRAGDPIKIRNVTRTIGRPVVAKRYVAHVALAY